MSRLFSMAQMPLLDHIIIGNDDRYYSFKENSILPIGTQMFARSPEEIQFAKASEPVVAESRPLTGVHRNRGRKRSGRLRSGWNRVYTRFLKATIIRLIFAQWRSSITIR